MARRRTSLARLLGRRIAALRAERGLTQERLAWESGLESKGYLSRIESGQRLPSLDVLAELAARLHVQPRDLLIFPEHDDVAAVMELVRRGGEVGVERARRALAPVGHQELASRTGSLEGSQRAAEPRKRRPAPPKARAGR